MAELDPNGPVLGNHPVYMLRIPWERRRTYSLSIDAVPGWVSEVVNLLECHKVYLYHRPDEFYLVKMFGDLDGGLMPIPFKTSATVGRNVHGRTACLRANGDTASTSSEPGECQLTEMEQAQTEGKAVADQFDASPTSASRPTGRGRGKT
ncbi:MAG: hypothetical protein F4X72_14630 [Dehalococcoidia bacterium]|nr:hypothetical protein [Dehalococcoidia bacterium]